jgi:DNA-binding PadR family transcriptional regulator
MSIKHAVLGLIAEQPMHGYRVKEAFDERMTPLWGLTTAQIYQTLGALERAGLVASRGERVGSRPTRRIYSVTDAGARELRRWLRASRSARARSFRGELPIRLMLLRPSGVGELSALLERCEHDAKHLHARVSEFPRPPRAHDAQIDVLGVFLDTMARQLEAELATLRRCREEVARWISARKVATPSGADEDAVGDTRARHP